MMWDRVMFRKRRLRRQDVLFQFELISWLIQRDGPPAAPPKPARIRAFRGLSSSYWKETDTQTVFDWASGIFGTVKHNCGMDDWPVQFVPGECQDVSANIVEFKRSLANNASSPYIQGRFDFLQIGYDPRLCSKPGYLQSLAIVKLAELRAIDFQPSFRDFGNNNRLLLCLIAGAFGGQGFKIASHKQGISDFLSQFVAPHDLPERFTSQSLAFAICLSLLASGLTREDILKDYRSCVPVPFGRKMRIALKQISDFPQEVAYLQSLSSGDRDTYDSDAAIDSRDAVSRNNPLRPLTNAG